MEGIETFTKQAGGYEVAAATSQGVGSSNQDRFCVCGGGVALVDGMGGLAAGGAFAEVAVTCMGRSLDEGGSCPVGILSDANRRLEVLGRDVIGDHGGASGCACRFIDGGYELASSGDIKALLIGVAEYSTERLLRIDAASDGTLTSYLGASNYLSQLPVTISKESSEGSVLVLASDGVWKYVSQIEVAYTIAECVDDLEQAAERIVAAARRELSKDDATVVLCRPVS